MQNPRKMRGRVQIGENLRSSAVSTAAPTNSRQIDPIEALRLRAWARARLCVEGILDLHEAVDRLQADAERDGIDTDIAQAIMADAFGATRNG